MKAKQVRKLKRTVLIGLGGTGKRALLYAKKHFLETFGEEPPLVKFLLIDTTSANTDSVSAKTPDGPTEKARLKASEVLHIEARGASLLPQVHEEIRGWFPPKADLKANILSGAGQIRPLGRLALFANATTVYENLRDLLALARDYLDERPSEERHYIYEPYTPHLTVALVGSLAGGTGSGIFLDVAFVLRELMKDEDQLFGYFLLPDIYVNRPGTQNVEANAYAALKELDHFMSREDTWTYLFGGRRIQVRKKPFDMVFLVNRQNRAGKTFNDVDDLAELLGLGLYLVSGPLGKEQVDLFDNIVHQLNEQKGKYYGKTAHYASFGAAELRFNPASVLSTASREWAQATLREWLEPKAPWAAHEVLTRFAEIETKPLPEEIESASPEVSSSSSRREDLQVWNSLRPQLESRVDQVKEKALNSWALLDIDAVLEKAFRDHHLQDLIVGLEVVEKSLDELLDQLRAKEGEARDEYKGAIEGVLKDIDRAHSRRLAIPLFSSRQDEDGVLDRRRINSLWRAATRAGAAAARYELAKRALDQIRAKKEELIRLRRRLEEHLGALGSSEAKGGVGRDQNPFSLTLPPPYLEVQGSFATRSALERPSLKELLADTEGVVQRLQKGVKTSLRQWLSEVVRHREEEPMLWEAVERTFRELDQLSAPAWDYEDAWVANPKLGYRELVHIVGLEDASDREHPLVSDEELLSVFAGTLHDRLRLQKVSTGDPDRVLFYKVEASIPAFALRGISLYRERYLQLSGERSFHVHREWEEGLPDLLPLPRPEEVAEVWTKARLFGILLKENREDPYRFPDHRRGKGNFYTLGNRPAEAYSALAQDFFAFKDLEAQVRAEENRRKASSEKLLKLLEGVRQARENRQSMVAEASGEWTEEDLNVFRQELRVLEAFEDELSRYNPSHGEDKFPSV